MHGTCRGMQVGEPISVRPRVGSDGLRSGTQQPPPLARILQG